MINAISQLKISDSVFTSVVHIIERGSLSKHLNGKCYFFLFKFVFNILICSNSSENLTKQGVWWLLLPMLSLGLYFVSYLWNWTLATMQSCTLAYRGQQYGLWYKVQLCHSTTILLTTLTYLLCLLSLYAACAMSSMWTQQAIGKGICRWRYVLLVFCNRDCIIILVNAFSSQWSSAVLCHG